MSWSVYVYAPTEGVEKIALAFSSDTSAIEEVYPQGTSTPCYKNTACVDGDRLAIIATLADGYQVTQWVINEDGAVSYEDDLLNTSGKGGIAYDHSGASKVYIRLEVEAEETVDTYYATIAFNANGGTGAPSGWTDYSEGSSTVPFDIPTTIPTRSGYTFAGWELTYSSGSTVYQPGDTARFEGTTGGVTYTLYAIWEEVETGGGVWIYTDNDWAHATKYIVINKAWKKDTPYVVANKEWKKGT